MMLASLILTILLPHIVEANTEKTIFLGPPPVDVVAAQPRLADLHVQILTPDNFTIRTYLESSFPNHYSEYGEDSWFILDQLSPGQRYEVRVCWAATSPSAFKLHAYEPTQVFDDSHLSLRVSQYAQSLGSNDNGQTEHVPQSHSFHSFDRPSSVLLLQIFTLADYYTTNRTLMQYPPPVFVDIILDPFILNVLPRSLLPTVGYIILVSAVSWYLGRWVSEQIHRMAQTPTGEKKSV
ncbi:hypothetical protein F5Y18DRAFT_104163 [Xylariaceae sp. FL1019]|nr:hypothetical protein F5Y18DRAFT_104163 [Xylariaceae sp. FL1019]